MTKTAADGDTAFLGHPRALGFLAFSEAWERFSYYGMQALLVLYMTKQLLLSPQVERIAGFEAFRGVLEAVYHPGASTQATASAIFGLYTSLVYLTPILGGFLADKVLGKTRTIILGALLMSAGHFLMAFDVSFLVALLCLILGTGCFKGNIAGQVGALYGDKDLRRADAFQIFYLGINAGVIAAPLIAGTLGEKVGWHYGFGAAGVGMLIALVIYLSGRRHLPPDPPLRGASAERPKLQPGEGKTILLLVALLPIMAASVLCNQQIFNAYLVWADQHFQLTFFGETLPTSWMITIDATASFSMLAAVAAFYVWYGKRHREPDELGKMIIGSVFTIAGGLCLVMAAATQGDGKIGLFWPVMFHLLNSIGFAHILPVSLALFTKLAPKALNATIVGIYYLAFFGANKIVGEVGTWYSSMPTTSFWLFHVATAAVGLVAFILFKLFLAKRLIGGSGKHVS